jgi:anti-sigma regulatory factor (Ser/Thr protein kinase)
MATVELSFTALPAHVRTARLVAAAVARRSGVDEAVLDEVRLAVGEACSRAVDLHLRFCPTEPVRVSLTDGVGGFVVEVTDCGPVEDGSTDALDPLRAVSELDGDSLPMGVGLAVISGLVDDFAVEPADAGMVVRMSWPVVAIPAPR